MLIIACIFRLLLHLLHYKFPVGTVFYPRLNLIELNACNIFNVENGFRARTMNALSLSLARPFTVNNRNKMAKLTMEKNKLITIWNLLMVDKWERDECEWGWYGEPQPSYTRVESGRSQDRERERGETCMRHANGDGNQPNQTEKDIQRIEMAKQRKEKRNGLFKTDIKDII